MFRTATAVIGKHIPRSIPASSARAWDSRLPYDLTVERLNFDTTRARTAAWEPSPPLLPLYTSTRPPQTQQHNDADTAPRSPWDPCATRPLLMSGVLSSPAMTLRTSAILGEMDVHVAESPARSREPALSRPADSMAAIAQKPSVVVHTPQPWPYRLPKFLQPKPGTTYHAMYGKVGAEDKDADAEPVGVLQAVLYGIPEPDGYVWRKERRWGMLVRRVLYGEGEVGTGDGKGEVKVEEGEEDKGGVVVAK
ncbi:hypothetical protein BU26DRAFT_559125 [Trematosphaeria pertusa]|uniref:Uncharacterized protein n=1 Tax=Trematosphaeria pertusa TaxID=390896 RepID=A0A6A6IVY9_9PLEO|nr:uncharacterized protein BU26DRAFT_559125 [Trematosphaeria pertusa]KAF2254438.1 hypothetical protein BU26DRAFT_559125 [Trematosphaeria pertusa]